MEREYPESDANVTTASLRGAAAVLERLADECEKPSAQYGCYLGVASRLQEVADERESASDGSPDRVVPIPPDAISDEGWHDIGKAVKGYADEERGEPDG
jgi:hypothetical protein